ncbi:MAG: redox-sensing transcriptional repressor Rex [Ruminococcaceae bacterium]|nr:redox-sensing transcriptional repressor Rex [Oscillospiraceae bacterium]
MNVKKVPEVVVKRLPRYYRYLDDLLKNKVYRISSAELSKKMNVTASQIRQDFNYFGGFGQQGFGYSVQMLHSEIGEILGLNKGLKTILVGAGNLGKAIANHAKFEKRGFHMIGAFDVSPEIVGKKIKDITIMDYSQMEAFVKEHNPDIAILTVSQKNVKDVAKHLEDIGIKALWNFSYTEFESDKMIVENVHLSDSIMMLSYKLHNE